MTFKAAFYKGTRPGYAGLVNRIGRRLDHGPYSHVELLFNNDMSGSSSFIDGGVRIKYIGYTSTNWDFIDLPPARHNDAYTWFVTNRNAKYDNMGVLNALLGFVSEDKDKFFCSEAVAAALGIREPWRYKPNGLYALLQDLNNIPWTQ